MSLDLTKLDMDRLKGDVTGALVDGISDLVQGTKEDVQAFGAAISKDMLEAHLTGDQEMVDQLLDQLELLGEINRVRVENHAWIVVGKVVKAVFSAAASGALSVIL